MQLAVPLSADPGAPLARANPLARVGAAALLMLFGFIAVDAVTAALLLAVTLVGVPMSGISARTLLRRAWPLLGAAVAIGILNAVFGQPEGAVVIAIGPMALHAGSLAAGIALGIRILAIALAGLLALAAVDPTDLADALIQQLHVSARFALGALAALRLLPILAAEWQLLGLARRARGVSAGSPLGWLRLSAGRLMSLLVGAIRRATRLSQAMEARGLGAGGRRSVARPQRMARRDWVLLLAALAAGLGATVISAALGSYRFLFG
ncbi:MAG TPA: energy-coupling factor transporter transmembrane component T [Candidatus Limnocylindria bacterium]|nr:energy-coupling factor transporter transmembrane component T [Candidatus Limnocylindria bacterium]